MVPTKLLLGDEAAAQAAIDAGIGGAFSYPGTPATEIFEYVDAHRARTGAAISALWSANEKVAYEEALGMSYAGRRALVSMKHVGLNVAADPFMSSAMTGVRAGLVLIVADDPGMHSSQSEQDSRHYQEFALLPMFEPGSQQAAYDLVLEAFDYSEAVGLPVMVRMVTRLCHSRAAVLVRDSGFERPAPPDRVLAAPSTDDWVLVPTNSRRRYRHLLGVQEQLLRDSGSSRANRLRLAGRRGIIATGIAANYVAEALGEQPEHSTLFIQRYPAPVSLVRELVDHCDDIVVVEEGAPFLERRLGGLLGIPGKSVRGKLTGALPIDGELTPDLVANALGAAHVSAAQPVSDLADRPPQLCKGCPHADSFRAIIEAAAPVGEALMMSDIGCYALGVAPPFRAVHSCVDMGASIAMAHGASQAGAHPVICTIGESTFAHSGMTPLIGAAKSDANMTVVILDNATVGMTGAQDTMVCGEPLLALLRGLGVRPEHLHVIEPLPRRHAENTALIRREIEHRGLSVIVAQRACIHVKRRAKDTVQEGSCGAGCACTPVTVGVARTP
ncbi:MAG: indolepyruvate ferredoxin oxidoreductase [Phycisphaerales bacterium]|nr:indolepyruvate ferredoxin oxidoreductase [Phycisphaerales bacterium]